MHWHWQTKVISGCVNADQVPRAEMKKLVDECSADSQGPDFSAILISTLEGVLVNSTEDEWAQASKKVLDLLQASLQAQPDT